MVYRNRRRPSNSRAAALCAAYNRPVQPYRSPPPVSPALPEQTADVFYEPEPFIPAEDSAGAQNSPPTQPDTYPQTFPHEEAFCKGTLFPELFTPMGRNIFGR